MCLEEITTSLLILKILNQNSGAFLVLFSFIVAIATVVYAKLTSNLVKETKKMRKIQTDPNISVFVQPGGRFVNLVIQNIGLGSAYNINFASDPDFKIFDDLLFSELSFVKNGIKYLAPNQKLWVLSASVYKAEKKIEPIKITVSFQNSEKKSYCNSFIINFSEFFDLGMLEEAIQKEISISLKKIATGIPSIISAINTISRKR